MGKAFTIQEQSGFRTMIQEKAVEFAALFNVTGFEASSRRLHRFCVHYEIAFKQVCSEVSSTDAAAASMWREGKLQVISDYSPDNVCYTRDQCILLAAPEQNHVLQRRHMQR